MAFIFKYSERSGTPAEDLEDSVPTTVKESRNQELLSLLAKQSYYSNTLSLGKSFEVLVEGRAKKGKNMMLGRTRCNRKVVFEGSDDTVGELIPIFINDVSSTTLTGEIVKK
jgi:tRNA-2-methylthio-N6-dimethylallyladenosine synthase